MLFCMTIQPLLQSLSSELVAAYMDDVTLAGNKSTVADDINTISTFGPSYMDSSSTCPSVKPSHGQGLYITQ